MSLRSKIEARLSDLRELRSRCVWNDRADGPIEILEWVLSEMPEPSEHWITASVPIKDACAPLTLETLLSHCGNMGHPHHCDCKARTAFSHIEGRVLKPEEE